MIKSKIVALLFLFFSSVLFAYGGLMKGAKEVKYVKTDYFDIYYSEQSYEFAELLVKEADSIYTDICDNYKIKPTRRYPVILACNTDYYNSYVSYSYYTHIVMFDSIVTPELSLFKDNQVLGVFKHELTHAIIWNNFLSDEMKNTQRLFGDHFVLGNFKITTTLNEGASIASESSNEGEGRLNDGYYLHLIRQLKLLDSIPGWRDAMGNTSTHIEGGINYDIGGPFTKYIQDTYGIEKFVEFITDCVNSFRRAYISQSFKKVYGKSFDDIWNEFVGGIEVPEINPNPLENEYVHDFFDYVKGKEEKHTFNIKNRTTSLFSSLSQSIDGILFTDRATGKVYKAVKNSDGSLKKSKLVTQSVLYTGEKISSDGKFIALDFVKKVSDGYKFNSGIFDIKSGKTYKLKKNGVKDSVVLKKGSDYYLVCYSYKGQKSSLDYYKVLFGKRNNCRGFELYKSIPVEKSEIIYSLTPADFDEGKLAVIVQKDLKWLIRIYENDTYCDYSMPDYFRIRHLTYNPEQDSFSMSYVTKDSFPRFAIFDTKSQALKYMDEDLSGGVYSNVCLGNKIIYSANFVTDKKLLILDLDKVKLSEVKCIKENYEVKKEDAPLVIDRLESLNPKDYKLSNFSFVVPFLAMNQYSADFGRFSSVGTFSDMYLGFINYVNLGFSLINSDPWDNRRNVFSIGYNLLSDYIEMSNMVSWDNSTWGGNLSIVNSSNFIIQDLKESILHADNYFEIQKKILTKNNYEIDLYDTNLAFVGKRMEFNSNGKLKLDDLNSYYHEDNQIGLAFAKRFTAPGYLGNQRYILLSVSYQSVIQGTLGEIEGENYFDLEEDEHKYIDFYQNIKPTFAFATNLLPINCVRNYSYNLPTAVTLALFEDEWKFLSGTCDVILFEFEIQTAFKYLPIYNHRMIFSFDYDFYFRGHNEDFEIKNTISDFKSLRDYDYADSFGLNVALAFGTNIGVYANSLSTFCPYIGIMYTNMNGSSKNKPLENRKIELSLGLKMRY